MSENRLFRLTEAPDYIFEHLVAEQFSVQQVRRWKNKGLRTQRIGRIDFTCIAWLRDYLGITKGSEDQSPATNKIEAARNSKKVMFANPL